MPTQQRLESTGHQPETRERPDATLLAPCTAHAVPRMLGISCLMTVLACSEMPNDAQEARDPTPELASKTELLVGTKVATDASETQVAFSGPVAFFAYNAKDKNNKVTYPNSGSRNIFPGASETGYSICPYGQCTQSFVSPPSGWPVLWGDPGLGVIATGGHTYGFLSSLAIPAEKMPAVISGEVESDTLPASYGGAYIGGICVARSVDYGPFTTSSADCLRKTDTLHPAGVFYDGTAVTAGNRIYVATRDVTNSMIDVYKAASPTAAFVRMADPFPGRSMAMHPRLCSDALSTPYLIAPDVGGNLLITMTGLGSDTWRAPVVVGQTTLLEKVTLPGGEVLRVGPQYSVACGLNEAASKEEIRVAFTTKVAGVLKVHVAICSPSLVCTQPTEWITDALASDQFNPIIASTTLKDSAGNNFGSWRINFFSRQNNPVGNTIEIITGTPVETNSGGHSLSTGPFVDPEKPCTDFRGYFGDYDGLAYWPQIGKWGRAYTAALESPGPGCNAQQFTASPMNVDVAFSL